MARASRASTGSNTHWCGAFTLVELLIAIGIIAILIALLLPALAGARRSAKTVQCVSNLRQICMALQGYASDNQGKFPRNTGFTPDGYWFGEPVLGPWVSAPIVSPSRGLGGGVLVCPEDEEPSQRSYSINFWASSYTGYDPAIPGGRFWSATARGAERLILVTERWTDVNDQWGWYTSTRMIGMVGASPGQKFGGGGGLAPPVYMGKRWGRVNCELPYIRHSKRNGAGVGSGACVNIGYADGHVATKLQDELVDMASGKSTLDSLWSPLDPELP